MYEPGSCKVGLMFGPEPDWLASVVRSTVVWQIVWERDIQYDLLLMPLIKQHHCKAQWQILYKTLGPNSGDPGSHHLFGAVSNQI